MKNRFIRRGHGSPSWLKRFSAEESGNVAVLFAMSAVVLMLAIGAAVDIGRWLHARDQTISAMDAAVLAGGRALQTDSTNTAAAVAAAQKFYQENVTSRLPVTGDTVQFQVVDNGSAVTASGKAYIKTPFLGLANIEKLPLVDISEARAERKVSNKEISLMLDVTGSMCGSAYVASCSSGSKLDAMKDAAKDLVNIVLPEGQAVDSVKVAVVPFSEDIRLPTTTAMNLARGTNLSSCKELKNGSASSCDNGGGYYFGGYGGYGGSSGTDYYLSSCVVERSGAQKYTDAAPGPNQYVMAHYTEDYTTSGYGYNSSKNGKCTIPSGSEVMPLSSDRNALLAKINGMSASGGTAGHLGTAWAWYTLSPNWGSLWSSNSQPQAYDTQGLRKIAILMTDGEYNTEYDKNGVRVGSKDAGSAVNGTSTAQARALCTAMKQKGIEIYTIGFNIGSSNSEAYQTLEQCASESVKFYHPVTNEQLAQAFHDIGLKLSQLHLSK